MPTWETRPLSERKTPRSARGRIIMRENPWKKRSYTGTPPHHPGGSTAKETQGNQSRNYRFFLAQREKQFEHAPLKPAVFLPQKRKTALVGAQSPRRRFAAQIPVFALKVTEKVFALMRENNSFYWLCADKQKTLRFPL